MCWGCNCLSSLLLQDVSSNSGIVCSGRAAEGRTYLICGTRDPDGMECGEMKAFSQDGTEILLRCDLTQRQKGILLAGGLLNYTKENAL